MVLVEYDIQTYGISLRIARTNDPDYLYDELDIEYDISQVDATRFKQVIMDGDNLRHVITVVFNPDKKLLFGCIAREAYICTEIVMDHIDEVTDCVAVKSRLIEWIANKIDSFLYSNA